MDKYYERKYLEWIDKLKDTSVEELKKIVIKNIGTPRWLAAQYCLKVEEFYIDETEYVSEEDLLPHNMNEIYITSLEQTLDEYLDMRQEYYFVQYGC